MKFVPVTPAGTPCMQLARRTEEAAWAALMEDAKHMPYENQAAFEKRGYTVEQWEDE